MSEALVELLFWVVVFVALFFGFRKLQKRKEAATEKMRQKEAKASAAGKDPGDA